MRKLLAATVLLFAATPAWADWGATKWGMSVDDVLATVPGARELERKGTGSDVWDHYRLASAPWQDGTFATTADFFFTPDDHKLAFVKLIPTDVTQCPAYSAMLVARYGKGEAEGRDFPDMGVSLKGIRWVDPKTHERLLYSTMTKKGVSVYCHFIQQVPE